MYNFLKAHRSEILDLSKEKSKDLAGLLDVSPELERGLPIFYEQLIEVLRVKDEDYRTEEMLAEAAAHGKEFLALGYTLSHVVHSYGALCQSITETAIKLNAKISPDDFRKLNGCLDVVIASAVSEFQYRSNLAVERREVKHLGFLAHELRNALSSATMAHEMIKAGSVGAGGVTSRVLEQNLVTMRNLIDRSLSEVRMRSDSDVLIEKFRLSDLLDQIAVTSRMDGNKKSQTLYVKCDRDIFVEANRHYLLSAVANLVQNAIKFTRVKGSIILRGKLKDNRAIVEIEDQCGGIPTDQIDSIMKPFVHFGSENGGLGLGLPIAKRAIGLSQGRLTIENNMGVGCTFKIDIPRIFEPEPSNKSAVPGEDAVQPDLFGKISGSK